MTFQEIVFKKIERFERGYKYCYTFHSEMPELVGTWFDSHGKKTKAPLEFEIVESDILEDPYFIFIESISAAGCYPGGTSQAMLELKDRSCQQ